MIEMEETVMKKILTGLLVAVLAVSAGTVTTFAAESVYGKHYADCNGDGVCDYCGQEDGCNLEICNVKGRYFVDKDGDGICDNCAEGSSKCKSQRKYRNFKNCRNYSNSRHCGSSHKGHHKNR